MNFRGFRFRVALLAFLILSTLGIGAKYLHQQTQVLGPLVEQIQEISGIVAVQSGKSVLDRTAKVLVTLELAQEASLGVVFPQVYQTLLSQGGNYAVRIKDEPNGTLLNLFKRVQIAVEEAVVTGEFTLLEHRLEDLAEAGGVSWDLGLDREFIYVSLAQGEHSLRRIVSRGSGEGRVRVYPDGGDQSWPNG